MLVASVITVGLKYPASPIHPALAQFPSKSAAPIVHRLLIGLTMGLTAIALIYSPWGKQSGAHFNPVVTLTFLRLGKVRPADALGYILAQFIGGWLGILLATQVLGSAIAHPSVNYIVTQPGTPGAGLAFLGEFIISFGMMMMVLFVSNTPRLARFTGICAGLLIATYITLEAPLSGMSMNPARTLASAIPAQSWTDLWVYFTAPLLGMGFASEVYLRQAGRRAVRCAKLHHDNHKRCIFNCGYRALEMGNGSQQLSDRLI